MLELADRRGLGPRGRKTVEVQLLPRAPNKMKNNLDQIEEKEREEIIAKQKKKKMPVSGRSVFGLKKIIEKKASLPKDVDDEHNE